MAWTGLSGDCERRDISFFYEIWAELLRFAPIRIFCGGHCTIELLFCWLASGTLIYGRSRKKQVSSGQEIYNVRSDNKVGKVIPLQARCGPEGG